MARKTSGGTVDEESFHSMFSLVRRVEGEVIISSRHLDLELANLQASLASTDWNSKVSAFQSVRGLVNASASLADEFVEKLKYLEAPVLACLKDLRSQVIRECCVTIAYIAQQFQYKVFLSSFELTHLTCVSLHLISIFFLRASSLSLVGGEFSGSSASSPHFANSE